MLSSTTDIANLLKNHESRVRQTFKAMAPAHREALEYHLMLLQEKFATEAASVAEERMVRRAQGGFKAMTALLDLLQNDQAVQGRPEPGGQRPSNML